MLTKQNLCRYVIFSQNCCFVANFVDKGLVDDSTSDYAQSLLMLVKVSLPVCVYSYTYLSHI